MQGVSSKYIPYNKKHLQKEEKRRFLSSHMEASANQVSTESPALGS